MCIPDADHTLSYSSSPPRSSILLLSVSSSNSYAPYIYDPCPPAPPPETSSTPDHSNNSLRGLGQKARRVGKSIKEKGEQFLRVAEGSTYRSGSPGLTYDHGARVGEDTNVAAIFNNMGMIEGTANRQTTGGPLAHIPRPEPDHRVASEALVAESSGYRAFNGKPTPVVAVYPDTPEHYIHLGRIPDGTGTAPAELPEDRRFEGVAEKRYYEMFVETYPRSSPSAPFPAENPNPARPSRAAAEKVRAARGAVPAAANGEALYPLSPPNATGSEMPALQHPGYSRAWSQNSDQYWKPVRTVSADKCKRRSADLTAPKGDRISLHFGTDIALPSASNFSLPSRAKVANLSSDADVPIETDLRRGSRPLPQLKLDGDLDITVPHTSRSNDLDSISQSVAKGKVRNTSEAASISKFEVKAQKHGKKRISSGVLPDQTPFREVIQAAIREHLLSTDTKPLHSGNIVSPLEIESPKIGAGRHNRSPQSGPRSNVIAETKVDEIQIATAQSLRRVKAAPVEVRSLAGPVPLGELHITTTTGSLLDGPVPSSLQSKPLSNQTSSVDNTRRNWNWGRFIDTDYEDPAVAHSRHFREKKAWAKHNNGALIVFTEADEEKEEKRKSLMGLMKEKSIGELLDFFEGKKG